MRILIGLVLIFLGLFLLALIMAGFLIDKKRAAAQAALSTFISLIMGSFGCLIVPAAMIVAGAMMIFYEVTGG